MPLRETPNTVTVGKICQSCALFATEQCPYGNHLKKHVTEYKGDIRGKCTFYMSLQNAKEDKKMKKESRTVGEAKLNLELYKKIYALNQSQRGKLLEFFDGKKAMKDKNLEKSTFDYWNRVFGPEYARDMVDEENLSKQQNTDPREVGTKKDKETKNKKKKKDKKKDFSKVDYYKHKS